MEKLLQIQERLRNMNQTISEDLKTEGEINSIIYHYTDASAIKNILEKETLWLSNGKFMNDSTDLIYAIHIIEEVEEAVIKNGIGKFKIGYEFPKICGFFQGKIKILMETLKSKLSNVFLLSTSHNQDSLALWSNYSSEEGYNLGLDADKILLILQTLSVRKEKDKDQLNIYNDQFRISTNKNKLVDARKNFSIFCNRVIYEPERQKEIVTKYLKLFFDEVCCVYYQAEKEENNYIDSNIIETIAAQLAIYSVFIKNPGFRQEEEFRIAFITHYNEVRKEIIKFKIYKGIFIPYIEIHFNPDSKEIRQLPLKSITIGPKNNLDIAEDGLGNLLDILKYDVNKLTINRSSIPLRY